MISHLDVLARPKKGEPCRPFQRKLYKYNKQALLVQVNLTRIIYQEVVATRRRLQVSQNKRRRTLVFILLKIEYYVLLSRSSCCSAVLGLNVLRVRYPFFLLKREEYIGCNRVSIASSLHGFPFKHK